MSAHAQVKAVIGTVSSNASLYTEGFNDVFIKVITVTSDRFSLVSKLDKVKDYVYNELSKELPFTLVPENSVLGNEAFQAYAKEDNEKINAINTAVKAISVGSGIAGGQIVKNRGNIPIALNEAMDNVFVDMQESLPKAIKKEISKIQI
ncbi:MAG: hypothetical protein LBS09_09450 [Bacteroidales bacterium]|nr:hypothetical protein [Bacteroidales bacterium]